MDDNKTTTVFGMTVDQFLDEDILKLLGVQNTTSEEKQELYKKMLDTIQMRVIARIDDMLQNDDKRGLFKKMVDFGDNKSIEDFLLKNNIDIKKLLIEETLTYKTELVALVKTQNELKQ